MRMKCFGCGVEKDTEVRETYRYKDETEAEAGPPMVPLFVICCEGYDEHSGTWKVAVICHGCCERLEPDQWISSNCWKSLSPVVLFENLPSHDLCGTDNHKLEAYAHIQVGEKS